MAPCPTPRHVAAAPGFAHVVARRRRRLSRGGGRALQVVELVLAHLKPRFLGVKSRALHKHVRSVQLQQEGCAAEAAPAASS